jgi:hypothetical protein
LSRSLGSAVLLVVSVVDMSTTARADLAATALWIRSGLGADTVAMGN